MDNIKNKVYYLDKVIEIAESLNWSVYEGKNYIEFQKYSSAGQDFNITINKYANYQDFCNDLYEQYMSYDPSSEAYLWLDSDGHGINGAPYEMVDVYNDCVECEEMIGELWRALRDCEDIPETLEEYDETEV